MEPKVNRVQIFVDGEWVDLPLGQVEFTPALPPGQVFGQYVEQVRPGVYEIPDSLLMQAGPDVLATADALAREFLIRNPGFEIHRLYDLARKVTVFELKEVADNGDEER